jgi:hypothetical protein
MYEFDFSFHLFKKLFIVDLVDPIVIQVIINFFIILRLIKNLKDQVGVCLKLDLTLAYITYLMIITLLWVREVHIKDNIHHNSLMNKIFILLFFF